MLARRELDTLAPMPTLYNRITNQNLDRLASLSGGIFAVAMTLLVQLNYAITPQGGWFRCKDEGTE